MLNAPSRTHGGCLLDDREWRKSSRSGAGNDCVEMATRPDSGIFGVRDSKSPAAGRLVLPDAARAALMGFARAA